jgi:hypothetical protein
MLFAMRRKAVILLATIPTLAVGVSVAWPRIDFWMLTGSFSPIRKIDSLQHPMEVTKWDASGLLLADGRTVQLPGVTLLPEDSPVLREALRRGVEVGQHGRILALVRIHHWCGNDPVQEHVAKVDLSDMMLFLRLGQPTTTVAETEFLVKELGGGFSESGWAISEYLQFQSWQSLRHVAQ